MTAVLTHAQPHVALDFVQIKLIPKKTRPFEKKNTVTTIGTLKEFKRKQQSKQSCQSDNIQQVHQQWVYQGLPSGIGRPGRIEDKGTIQPRDNRDPAEKTRATRVVSTKIPLEYLPARVEVFMAIGTPRVLGSVYGCQVHPSTKLQMWRPKPIELLRNVLITNYPLGKYACASR